MEKSTRGPEMCEKFERKSSVMQNKNLINLNVKAKVKQTEGKGLSQSSVLKVIEQHFS